MKPLNAATIVVCLTLLVADLSSPGQFRFALPIDQARSIAAQIKPSLGRGIRSGMEQFESAEFVAKVCPKSSLNGVAAAQVKAFTSSRPELGSDSDQVHRILGLPDCANLKTAQYFSDQGPIVIQYEKNKVVGYKIGN